MERELRRDQWRTFFDAFSRSPDAWLISVDCDRIGSAFRDLPLRGIAVDADTIEIFAQAPDGTHIAHIVRHPERVVSDVTSEGGDVAVAIVNAAGNRTVVSFRSAAAVEMAGGFAPAQESVR